MASIASLHWSRLLTAEEFFQIDFGPDLKAELDNGLIRMMGGGTRAHSRMQARLLKIFGNRLSGSLSEPHGSDMAIQTREMGVRYPDVTIDCGGSEDAAGDVRLTNPKIVVEILCPSTRDYDLQVKRAEYRDLASVDTIVVIDLEDRTLLVHQRVDHGWHELLQQDGDLHLPAVALTIPHAEIFARD